MNRIIRNMQHAALRMALVIGAFAPSGCCYWQNTCKDPNPVLQGEVDCTKADLAAAIKNVMPEVLAALASLNPAPLLVALELEGEQAVECAVDAVVQQSAPPTSQPSSQPAALSMAEIQKKAVYAQIYQNGQAYLATKGVKIGKHAKVH